MADLLSHPWTPWIVGALVLLVLYQKLAPRLHISVPGIPLTRQELLGRVLGPSYREAQLKKTVNRYKSQGHYVAAGKLLEDMGKTEAAVEAYLQGDEYWPAATMLERLGRNARAAELFLKAGDHKKAADVFIKAGQPGKAAALFQERGNTLEAARLYGIAGEWDKAAQLYAKGGYPLRAAEAYEKNGQLLLAAECHEKHFMENVSYSTTYSATAVSPDQKSALLAGRLYEKAGEPERALKAYEKGGFFKEAGETCVSLKRYARAAELFLRVEQTERAADAYELAGDSVHAAALRGDVALKADRVPEAAAYFLEGKDYLRAAELYESAGMLAEAAGAFEAGDSHAAAGSVYVRAGMKERAAASYERAREFETAARLFDEIDDPSRASALYEKAGLCFLAGRTAASAGERDRAISLLQRVGPGEEDHRSATQQLAVLFIETGRAALAVERLRTVLRDQPVSSANVELYYLMALAAEEAGDVTAAQALYKKIQAEDLSYRDVAPRLEALAAGKKLPLPATTHPARAAKPAATPTSRPAVDPSRFERGEPLGRGPLGTTYHARDNATGRDVRLRILPGEVSARRPLMEALAAELRSAAQLSHPHLARVLGLISLAGEHCVVSEWVDGQPLVKTIDSGQTWGWPQVQSLGDTLAQALSALHSRGLVHGLVGPSSVIVGSARTRLTDVGLGRLAEVVPQAPRYAPPEGGLHPWGDLYALTALLYQLLTGRDPVKQPHGASFPLPSALVPGVPEEFDQLVFRNLHPQPALRSESADHFLRELRPPPR